VRAAAAETSTRRPPTLASLTGAVNTPGGEGIAAVPYLGCGTHYDEEKRKPDVTTADTDFLAAARYSIRCSGMLDLLSNAERPSVPHRRAFGPGDFARVRYGFEEALWNLNGLTPTS
jgi:glycerol dehydrogenase-like iron-containing ADH family enzyme